MIQNLFESAAAAQVIERINRLQPTDLPLWGKMSADQMLAHCNVAYAFAYEPELYPKPGAFKKFMLKAFVKNFVVSEKPYSQNGRTAPEFIIVGNKDFEQEKSKLISNIQKTQQLGAAHFEGKENLSFGKMSANEWNILFSKHIDHHLRQFGK